MADLTAKLECSGRRICVLSAPGDRRDEDIREIARIAARSFDRLILRRDDDLRGRGSDEVPLMMQAELSASGFPAEHVQVIPDEQAAIEAGLRSAKRGDLLLVFADKVSRSWKQVIYFKVEPAEGSSPPSAPPKDEAGDAGPVVDLPSNAFATHTDLLEGAELIKDERGVRLAREQDD